LTNFGLLLRILPLASKSSGQVKEMADETLR
jgi:hypothetical protein